MTLVLILLALLALSLLVVIHEFGHFLAAKISGVKVEEFAIGFPPRIWGVKKGETFYAVNALPIGGYVKLHGEEGSEGVKEPKRAFVNKGLLVKAFISLAGVFSNFLFGILVFTLIFSVTGVPKGAVVEEVQDNSPAESAGIMPADEIVSIDGRKVIRTDDLLWYLTGKASKEVVVGIKRGEKSLSFQILLRENPDEGLLGVVYSPIGLYRSPFYKAPFEYGNFGIQETWRFSKRIVLGFGMIASQAKHGKVPDGVLGPVGIIALVADFVSAGILPLLNLMALISINLAVLNLVPFPPLDGSRVLFAFVEKFGGKRILQKTQNAMQTLGMIALITLMLALTVREIPKIFGAKSLSGFVQSVLPQ